jgi:acetate kinase
MRILLAACEGDALVLYDGERRGRVEWIGGVATLRLGDGAPERVVAPDPAAAFALLLRHLGPADAVGVRVGAEGALAALASLAPLIAPPAPALRLPVAISARHVHLTEEAVERLFGPGHRLTPHKPLSQPGQYAAAEQVTLVGPRRRIEGVRVLGPCRDRCQVEISRTDEFFLGLDAPIRVSGDLDGTPGIALEGPADTLVLGEGVICARRHIHASPEEARRLGVVDREVVEVALDTAGRDLVFGDVVVRVTPGMNLEMHLDTDEGNAAEIVPGDAAVLAPTGTFARLVRRG